MPDDEVMELLRPFWDAPERAGVFSDFDGTLAPIVDEPAEARPHPRAVDVLDRLAKRFARVAVVSGRPLAFLREHLDGADVVLSGLYGLETLHGDEVTIDEEAEGWRSVIDELAAGAGDTAPPQVFVEVKGLSLAVHFRTAPAQADAAREWAEAEAARTGLALHPGRMSFELRPPVDRSKGTSVAALLDGLEAACFLGDDTGDLPAFDALEEVRKGGGHALRVGVRSEEAPAELLERADLVVDGPDGVVDLLDRLAWGP